MTGCGCAILRQRCAPCWPASSVIRLPQLFGVAGVADFSRLGANDHRHHALRIDTTLECIADSGECDLFDIGGKIVNIGQWQMIKPDHGKVIEYLAIAV